MMRLFNPLFITLLLAACGSESANTPETIREGGLPQSQRTQEDSPAGVKFNSGSPFKSLSDSQHDKND
jgi:hypothetical protein